MQSEFGQYIATKTEAERKVRTKNALDLRSADWLGIAHMPEIEKAGTEIMKQFGPECQAVFPCGGETPAHAALCKKISDFFGTDDTIVYASGMRIFEHLFEQEDAVITDELTRLNLTEDMRFCNAARYSYRHGSMSDLENQLMLSLAQRFRIIVTDGIFPVDGDFAHLDEICRLAGKYNALVLVDESCAAGITGPSGRGAAEYFGVSSQTDIFTGTFDGILEGISGGYISGRREIIEFLKTRLWPQPKSDALTPAACCLLLAAFDRIENGDNLRKKLKENTRYFCEQLKNAGFRIKTSGISACTVMTFDTMLTRVIAAQLKNDGIYAHPFSYPVVPKDNARIRFRISSRFSREELDRVVLSVIEHGRAAQII